MTTIAEYLSNTGLETSIASFSKGEVICKQNNAFSNFYMLNKGLAKLSKEHRSKTIIIQLLKADDILIFPLLTNKNIAPFTITAVENCEVITIPSSAFYKMLQNDNLLTTRILEVQEKLKTNFYNRIFSLTQKRAHGRVADALLYLADEIFQSNTFTLPLVRRELGAFTALSTESAIRILREMHHDKIINLNLRKITLTCRPLLEKISQFG